MKVILVVSIVLLGACAMSSNKHGMLEVSEDLGVDADRTTREGSADYKPLGCFDWKDINQQNIFGKTFKRVRGKTASIALDECVKTAKQKTIKLFGIRKQKRTFLCQQGNVKKWNPNSKVSDTCKDNIGSRNSIYIYNKSAPSVHKGNQCSLGGKFIADGAQEDVYNTSIDACQTCKCSGGELQCETKQYCHTDGPPGPHCEMKCCPDCSASCNGRQYWYEKKDDETCLFCICRGGRADCSKQRNPSICPASKR